MVSDGLRYICASFCGTALVQDLFANSGGYSALFILLNMTLGSDSHSAHTSGNQGLTTRTRCPYLLIPEFSPMAIRSSLLQLQSRNLRIRSRSEVTSVTRRLICFFHGNAIRCRGTALSVSFVRFELFGVIQGGSKMLHIIFRNANCFQVAAC